MFDLHSPPSEKVFKQIKDNFDISVQEFMDFTRQNEVDVEQYFDRLILEMNKLSLMEKFYIQLEKRRKMW